MSLSTVDFPQPDGPRMAMNSPLSGRSATENVTSRITVMSPNRLVTLRKSTTFGVGAGIHSRRSKNATTKTRRREDDTKKTSIYSGQKIVLPALRLEEISPELAGRRA